MRRILVGDILVVYHELLLCWKKKWQLIFKFESHFVSFHFFFRQTTERQREANHFRHLYKTYRSKRLENRRTHTQKWAGGRGGKK